MNNNLSNNMTNYLIHKDCIIIEKIEYDILIKENTSLKTELYTLRENQLNNLLIIETLKNDNRELINQIETLKKENVELRNEIEELKKQNAEIKKENIELRNEIEELKKENTEIKKENAELRNEIEELKKENAEIKKENIELRNEIQELKKENAEIKKENTEIKKENKNLINKVDKLTNQLNTFINKNYIKKLIIACQDLNSKESLETIFKIPVNKLMAKLRINRNDECHLILQNDDNNIILCKEKILFNHLFNLSKEQKDLLNKKIGSDLVNEIINFLGSKSYDSISPIIGDYEDDINEWFDE